MKEVEFQVVSTAGKIDCNLQEIKEALAVQMTAYTSLEITEGNIKERKADLATLRKIRTAVDNERKRVKKEFNKPYDAFEVEVKEVLALIDKPIGMIDSKLKEFDLKRVEEKQIHLHELYEENIGELSEFVPYEMVAKPQWDNASYTDKDVLYDISEVRLRVTTALNTIRALNSEIEDELIKILKENSYDITKAVQRNTQYIQDKSRVEAQVREEIKNEPAKEEVKPKAELMGELNNIVNAFKTVHFIVSAQDAEEVESYLNLSKITYSRVEE